MSAKLTEGETDKEGVNFIEQFLKTAKSFLGCRESDGSHRQIIELYNQLSPLPRGYRLSHSDPWCAAFVSVAGRGMGEVVKECSCPVMIERYKALGRWQSKAYSPQAADLIFYDWDGDKSSDHVGIVTDVGANLTIIEGNISDSVDYRIIPRDYPHILGYATPFGSLVQGKVPATTPSSFPLEGEGGPLAVDRGVPLTLPQLQKNSKGNSVKALQILLIGNGFDCGPYGADGDFGADTEKALKAYQQSKELSPDAIAGKQTWRKLLL